MDATLCFLPKVVKKQCRMHDPPPGNGPAAANTEGSEEGGTEVFLGGSLREGLSCPANARQTLPGGARGGGKSGFWFCEVPPVGFHFSPGRIPSVRLAGTARPTMGRTGGAVRPPAIPFRRGRGGGRREIMENIGIFACFPRWRGWFFFRFPGAVPAAWSRGSATLPGGHRGDALLRVRGGIFRAGKIPPCGGVGGIGRMRGLWTWIAGHSILRFAFRARRAGGGRSRRAAARGKPPNPSAASSSDS